MTYSALMVVVTLLTGAAIGGLGAASEKASWWTILLCALGGLVVGIVLGGLSKALAERTLALSNRHPNRLMRALLDLSYFAIPVVGFFGVVLVTTWLVRLL